MRSELAAKRLVQRQAVVLDIQPRLQRLQPSPEWRRGLATGKQCSPGPASLGHGEGEELFRERVDLGTQTAFLLKKPLLVELGLPRCR